MSTAFNAVSEISKGINSGARHFFGLVLATLREIGDENAYQRHLVSHGVPHSAQEWRRFCDERWLNSSRRARCC